MLGIMFMVMILSTIMALSSSNWIAIWISMEMNLFSFIPILLKSNSPYNYEDSMLYFISQSFGSSVMLATMLMTMNYSSTSNILSVTFCFSLLLKLGAAPCHYWFPIIMNNTTWTNCFLLATWQKVSPLFILVFTANPTITNILIPITALNALLGSLSALNQVHMKKIMAFSSISHLGWSLSCTTINMPCISITYFLSYMIISMPVFFLSCMKHMNFLSDLWSKSRSTSYIDLLALAVMLLSLGGLPPLLGFFPKLLVIFYMVSHNTLLLLTLLLSSIISLFFYLKITMSLLISLSYANPFQLLNSRHKYNTINSLIGSSIGVFGALFLSL